MELSKVEITFLEHIKAELLSIYVTDEEKNLASGPIDHPLSWPIIGTDIIGKNNEDAIRSLSNFFLFSNVEKKTAMYNGTDKIR